MKAIIIYYSQTGNTRKIAQAIYAGIKKVLKKVDILPLKEADPKKLGEYDLIGLGSPVWGFKEPPNVTAFIDKLVGMKGKHFFPFCTHGTLPSGYMQSMVPALRKKGMIFIGYNDWYGSCINQVLPRPYLTEGHLDDIDLKEAGDFGRQMADLSRRIYEGETGLIPKPPTMKEWNERYCGAPLKLTGELIRINDQTIAQKKINVEKCITCGLCVENCPTNCIDFSVSPPVFNNKKCVGCFFCEQICPTGALEVDWKEFGIVHDKYTKRVFAKRLDRAEAKGRFRRLIPEEKVGWNTLSYQVTEHPRYVID
jgi:flavodoxin/ferredoxin